MIEIVDYREDWPGAFAGLAKVLSNALGDLAVGIEHVGSTAVEGLAAKDIIDLDVIIDSRDLLPDVTAALSTLGYFHEGDLGITGREAFRREGNDVPRDGSGRGFWPEHHLYVCDKDNRQLVRHIAFRDFLRGHPDQAEKYAQLKRTLAGIHGGDRGAYTEAKTQFIAEIMAVIDRNNIA